ncbi:amino acid ABC transporter permease [Ramlibacter albus]|uniref:Glutamate/aspartate import permease protein GltK n=1 Tax=Ramlibacter albus TaxID=2079448 RepID=A0A923MCF7_9BURK|nr:amino acid ABC transporter permease [Ramlibacter albus]MBC5767823.1 amino acid ABC transporter permease [Ramlibacter albus]
MNYQWNFKAVLAYWPMFLEGLYGTVSIACVAVLIGLVAGGVLAAMRLSRTKWLRWPAAFYIDFYRNTPGIVHFFWFYYALPVLTSIRLGAFEAAVIALSTQSAAFYAEVFRGGINSIARGQWEGAFALGMTRLQAARRVIVPQAARRMIPPLTERTFELLKTTSLASTLAYSELLYQAMQVTSTTFRPLEVYTLVAAIYFVMLFVLSKLAGVAERRLALA